MATIEFNEERHEYTVDGAIIPSVTQILQPLHDFSDVPADVLQHAARRGKAAHKAAEDYDKGTLDVDALPAEIVPYAAAWVRFIEESGAKVEGIEQLGYHKKYRYAGTYDRTLQLNKELWLVDIKTTAIASPVAALQTAAYAALHDQGRGKKIKRRGTVLLKNTGAYELVAWDDPNDINVFLSLVNIHNWRSQHGN